MSIHRRQVRRSCYLPIADGTRLAVDVHLPSCALDRASGAPVPTILRQTRYFRRVSRRAAGRLLPANQFDLYHATRARFLRAGYAWVDVDVRGTGASFGTWELPWSPAEGRDGAAVVDFITRQPWSDGSVGVLGISYDGTTAEQTAAQGHPAVRALASRYTVWDVYADIAFPGGLFHEWFLRQWSDVNGELDRHAMSGAGARLVRMSLRGLEESASSVAASRVLRTLRRGDEKRPSALARFLDTFVEGVCPVDEDPRGILRARAIGEHAGSFDVYRGACGLSFRDEPGVIPGNPTLTIDDFSPHLRRRALEQTGIAILSESGWYDGSYGGSATKRHAAVQTPGSRLLLGPWDHGGRQHVVPGARPTPTTFDHDGELLRFFDLALGRPSHDVPRVRYFQYGDDAWRTADTWPPPSGTRSLFFGEGGSLRDSEDRSGEASDAYVIDHDVGSGPCSRYRSMLGLPLPTGYGDRAALATRTLGYISEPQPADLVLVGHPEVHLCVSADGPDAAVLAYLEEVTPTGQARLLSEGGLRLSLRGDPPEPPTFCMGSRRLLESGVPVRVIIPLLPLAVRIRRGSRLRVSLAGADADHFAVPSEAKRLRFHRPGCRILLPVAL